MIAAQSSVSSNITNRDLDDRQASGDLTSSNETLRVFAPLKDAYELELQSLLYVANEMETDECLDFEAFLAHDQSAREALATAVGMMHDLAALTPTMHAFFRGSLRHVGLLGCLFAALILVARGAFAVEPTISEVAPFLKTYCVRCHEGKDANGNIDLARVIGDDASQRPRFKDWKRIAKAIDRRLMPPKTEPQPNAAERTSFGNWFRTKFNANTATPADFRVRRLSAIEYRNTLESLVGFPLTVSIAASEQTRSERSLVMKMLPTDPKGESGYTNDTRGNPITPLLWDNYSYLADTALHRLFDKERRPALEALAGPINAGGMDETQAAFLLNRFHSRAWRRRVSLAETERILPSIKGKSGQELVNALKSEMKFVLMSPEFLYRGLLVKRQSGETAAVDGYELAERLSYFLWSEMPDDELVTLAEQGRLSEPANFKSQVERMLQSPKTRSLAEVFAVQWLLLDEIDNATNELAYNAALKGQPIEFINDLIVRNRPLIELLDSRTEFVNLYLIDYYQPDRNQLSKTARRDGVEREKVPLERFTLKATPGRGGLLTMPGVLTMNKSPIQRGTWLLERILGDPLGEPPPDVPPVKPSPPGQDLTFRERFAEHRTNKTCAVCHDRIDPLGFAFEAYHVNGAFKLAEDALKQRVGKVASGLKKEHLNPAKIDTSGKLHTGEQFANLEELKTILTSSQWPRVVENIVRQMLSFALCRELGHSDESVVQELTAELSSPGATWGDLIQRVATSVPFQFTRFPADPDSRTSTP